ncbi:S-protein homolog 4-like [Eucalyptus grandis]|uniref:S-protein homolog 4-like n=1 Tax=Eucalyptus grandis TaxID=71139 RepID=UPI00192EE8E2|nr:S-protein homolog 4-like [Eucalyptus grandis]
MMMKRRGMLLVLICSMLITSCHGSIWKKTSVIIYNNLTDESTLTVHCKSKKDDLGIRRIAQRSWQFSFIPSFLGRTLFFCSFSWSGGFEWFNICVQSRDEGKCIFCSWTISPNGPCRLNGLTGEYDLCYHWNRRS